MNKLTILVILFTPLFANSSYMQDDMPMNPEPGKCYARVVVPATYKTIYDKIMVKPETVSYKTVPAKHGYESKKVLVKDAYDQTYVVPATYKTVKERVKVESEKRAVATIPAVYKMVSKKIMVKPEGYEWKKGRGALQKVDNATGEILCYTKTPAVYKTIKERVLVKEASVRERIIPAKYGYVKKTVEATPEKIMKKSLPAVYKTVRVKKVIEDAREFKLTHPAVFKTIAKKQLVSNSYTQWQPILCKTNTSKTVIKRLQKSLSGEGMYKGSVNGVLSSKTMSAVKKYQMKNGLATGELTEETLNKLSIGL